MKESNQWGNTYVECSQQEYDDLAFRDKLEPDTTYIVSEIMTPFNAITINSNFNSAITVQDVISELYSKHSVRFTCTHCGTECFEECKFTPKCPNCGSLMNRV